MNYKRWLKVTVALNVVLLLATSTLALNKLGIINSSTFRTDEYSYLDNSQYAPNLSMFELNDEKTDIVFAGDSITSRCHFDELLETDKTILNRGIGSDTSEGLLNRIDEILCHAPSTIFIMIGVNDIGNGIPQEQTLNNYRSILEEIDNSNPDTVVYIQSILPCPSLGDNGPIANLNTELQKLSVEYDCKYIDLNKLYWNGNTIKADCFADDGVHLNGNGYEIWMSVLQPLISDINL